MLASFDYIHISKEINTLHPVQAKKFLSILNAVRDLLESKQRPIYRKINELTGCSSRTIAKFWKWLRSLGIDLSNIFKSRIEEVGKAIDKLKRKGFKPTYRRIREVMRCSYSTISKYFKIVGKKKALIPAKKNIKPLPYSKAAGLFRKLSQAEQERYFRRARDEAGDQSSSTLERFAIIIFARSKHAADLAEASKESSLFKPKIIKPTKTVELDPQVEVAVLEAFNSELKARNLIPFGGLEKKDKNYLKKLLDKGHSLEDILQVIKLKADEWLKETKMIPAFRPQTILNPSKFPTYLNQARSKEQKKVPKYKTLNPGTKLQYRGEIVEVDEEGVVIFMDDKRVHAIHPQDVWEMIQKGEMKIMEEVA